MNQQFCRCCLLEYPALTYNIFQNNIIPELIECVPNIRITSDDGLPEIICDLCWLRLREAVEFRRKCVRTDAELRKLHEMQQLQDCSNSMISCNAELDELALIDAEIFNKSSNLNEDEISMLAGILLEDYSFNNSSDDANEICTHIAADTAVNVFPTAASELNATIKANALVEPLTENNNLEPTSRQDKSLQNEKNINSNSDTGKSLYACSECEKKFTRNFQLRLHMISVHKLGNGKQYKCNECSKVFASQHSLKYHQKSLHSTERPFACNYCERRFILRSQLASHERTHTGELKPRIHKCIECGKHWPTKSDLRTHMRSHFPNMERPFKCVDCEKCFFTRGHLNSHMLVHTGEKPYVCEYCQKSYQSVGNLNNHVNHRHKKQLNKQKQLHL